MTVPEYPNQVWSIDWQSSKNDWRYQFMGWAEITKKPTALLDLTQQDSVTSLGSLNIIAVHQTKCGG